MDAFWSGDLATFLATAPGTIVAELARQQIHHFRRNEAEQLGAWHDSILALHAALAATAAVSWVLLEYPMLRLGMRIDALLLTDRAILVLEFKRSQLDLKAHRQVEDYALNLRDFHDSSRRHPIVPILVSDNADATRNPAPLFWHAVTDVLQTTPSGLAGLLEDIMRRIGAPDLPLDPVAWRGGAYRPVPTIIEAARMTYARHGVAEIAQSRAAATNLRDTADSIRAAIETARHVGEKIILFVTGIPGAGKTLCGLNIAFTEENPHTVFLSGNPTLVHVLREALVRDAIAQGASRRDATHRIKAKIQALPHFRNEYVREPGRAPPETIAVIDEAQRCWSRDYAIRKTLDKPVRLTDSEPGHLLEILGRHQGFSAILCLVGSGQEIHDGEGGIAEWGHALARHGAWQVHAPPDILVAADPRWRLGALPAARHQPGLHLDIAVRQIRSLQANAWVDAVLRGDARAARDIAEQCDPLPFARTRDLAAARRALRHRARGERRAGVVASSDAKRLRAEGLGAELPHMDAAAVARWFLDRYPEDVRASDALEQVATEFSCQGLELDFVLLCWDADLIRLPGQHPWQPRAFRGTRWQAVHAADCIANHINTYRVLLTRARYETIIYVPAGDPTDATRRPMIYDEIFRFLGACGVPCLDATINPPVAPARMTAPMLL